MAKHTPPKLPPGSVRKPRIRKAKLIKNILARQQRTRQRMRQRLGAKKAHDLVLTVHVRDASPDSAEAGVRRPQGPRGLSRRSVTRHLGSLREHVTASAEQMTVVGDWFEAQGLEIVQRRPRLGQIFLGGTEETIEKALGIDLVEVDVNGKAAYT